MLSYRYRDRFDIGTNSLSRIFYVVIRECVALQDSIDSDLLVRQAIQ